MLRRFEEVLQLGIWSYQQNRLGDADAAFEEAVELSFTLASAEPRLDILWGHAVARFQLGLTLNKLNAHPEAIPQLEEAVRVGRHALSLGAPVELEAQLPMFLVQLAKAYRGATGYATSSHGPLLDVEEMRTYRIEQMENGTWPRGTLLLFSDEQKIRALEPLNEAIPILRRLVRTDRDQFEGQLALSLNLLGETYIEAERFAEAEPPLREAEAMYRQLVLRDPDFFRHLLTDTLQLLRRIPSANPSAADRMSALEELLPMLRAEAHTTEDERENGMTMAKAGARDRLRDALRELADLYKESGQPEKSASLWDGELGTLMTETNRIRWG